MTMSNSMPYKEHEHVSDSAVVPVSETYRFDFTGNGNEYFRIWIINLCLTLATLGIYSAWAKVRRLQYFDRNTQLNGVAFNFHGNPMAIFKGRLVALVLFVAYHYAFGFSKAFGVTVITVLFLTLPWMLRSALQFRLRNTSYRGVRFYFGGSLKEAYLNYTPLLAILLLPAATVAVMPDSKNLVGLEFILLYLSWPVIHAAMKRYQQSHIVYGDQASTYKASIFALIKPYILAFLFAIGIVIVVVIVAVVIVVIMTIISKSTGATPGFNTGVGIGIVVMVLYAYGVYLVAGPFLQVTIWNLVWNSTQFPTFTVRSELVFWPYLRLQTKNLIFTLLTLGLYRPFAVVSVYQYRLAHMSVEGGSFDHIVQSGQNQQIAATGDSSADFFGIDLSF